MAATGRCSRCVRLCGAGCRAEWSRGVRSAAERGGAHAFRTRHAGDARRGRYACSAAIVHSRPPRTNIVAVGARITHRTACDSDVTDIGFRRDRDTNVTGAG
jgi:hypothetical protein